MKTCCPYCNGSGVREVVSRAHSPEAVFYYLKDQGLADQEQEHVIVLFLNNQNEIQSHEVVHKGTVDASMFNMRDVFRSAVRQNAKNIILAHNHPSGSLEASKEDISVTKKAIIAGELLEINVLDHIIATKGGFISLREKGSDLWD
jgi:DNA repair protein RadC